MTRFLIFVGAIFCLIILFNHAKKEKDMAYSSKNLIRLCGTYLGQTHTRSSRGSESTSIHISNNDKKQTFGLTDRTRISVEKMNTGMNLCVGYTDFSDFVGVPYAIEIDQQ
jgi:hypothetical protein